MSVLVAQQIDVHRASEGISAERHVMRDLKSQTRFSEGPFRLVCEFQRTTLASPVQNPPTSSAKRSATRRGKRQTRQKRQSRERKERPRMNGSAFVRDNLCTSSFACQLIGRDYARFMVVRLLLSLYKLRRCCFFRGSYEFKNYSVERAANTSPDVSLHVSTSDEDSRLISFHRGRGCGR